MPTRSLALVCLLTAAAAFVLPSTFPPFIAALLSIVLFHFEDSQVEEDSDDSTGLVETGHNQQEPSPSLHSATDAENSINANKSSSVDHQEPPSEVRSSSLRASRRQSSLDAVQGQTSEERVRARLNPKQLEMATRLLTRLRSDPTFRPDHPSLEANLVNARRFLQARGWNESVAESLWRKAVDWRINYKVTERRKKLHALKTLGPGVDPAFDFANRHWFVFKTAPDKHGVPGLVTRVGTADPYGIIREIDNQDHFIERMVDMLEQVIDEAIAKDVFDYGIVEIFDVREFKHVPNYFSRAYNSIGGFKQFAHIMDEVYAERVRRVVILGAPNVFRTIWNMVQSLVPKETKKKIVFTGASDEHKWLEALRQEFPEESIPKYMGGGGSDEGVLDGLIVPKGSFQQFLQDYTSKHQSFDIGLIADVQHCNAPDGYNFRKTRVRKYREALTGLKRAVDDWKTFKVDSVIQLGDLLDGNAKAIGDSQAAFDRVNAEFARLGPSIPVHHVIGNHELYNVKREELVRVLKGPVHPRTFFPAVKFGYHKYRFIVLDAYEHAVIGVDENHENYQLAKDILLKNHPRDWRTSKDWLNGIHGVHRRFVPYNGAISKKQLRFLETELEHAVKLKQFAVVITHVPLQPGSCSSSCLVWNYQDVLQVLDKYSAGKNGGEGGVVLVLAGHDHKGGYALDPAGVHHVTLASPLEAPDCLAHGILRLTPRGLYLKGFGEVKDVPLPVYKTGQEVQTAYDKYRQEAVKRFYDACVASGLNKSMEECDRVWREHGGAWDALPENESWPKQYPDE